MRVRKKKGDKRVIKAAKRVVEQRMHTSPRMKRIAEKNQKLASSIDINQLLKNSPGKAINVKQNGVVDINYKDPAQKEWAEDWLKD